MNGQKFSLSFSKRIEKKSLQPSALRSEGKGEVKCVPQALLAVDQDSLQVNENAGEEELVIPLLQAKRSAVLSRLAKLQQEDGGKAAEGKKKEEEEEANQEPQEEIKELTLEEKAERALLEESRRRLDEWTTRDVKKDITIPAEDPLSAPLVDIGKESSLDDYDEIAVESFGAALLRGMGWKKSEGIGGREKKVIEIIDPSSKTLGSSEGKPPAGHKKEGEEEGEAEEELPIVKGAFVFLHSGRHRGTYGVVEVVDEDHLLIRAAVGQTVVREVEGNLRVATQKEYKESSRVINKEMYDKFKEAEIKKNEAKQKTRQEEDREGSGSDRDRKTAQRTKTKDKEDTHRDPSSRDTAQRTTESENAEENKSRRVKERDTERQRDKTERLRDEKEERPREKVTERQRDKDEARRRDRDEERQRRHREKETERERYKERKQDERKERSQDSHLTKRRQDQITEGQKDTKTKQQKVMVPPWVRENLRVRVINKNYKGGKYHKEKVVVMSVVTAESCECVTEGGRVLGGVDPAWLETVIPKQSPMVVMVVRGQHMGQKGRILQLHKDQEKASIQLLEDDTCILKLHYDDICEYVLR